MMTISGRHVTQTDGAPSTSDICMVLPRVPRFAGHTLQYWTVGHHSLVVEELVEHWPLLPLAPHTHLCAQKYALLHDAHEVCTSDVPTTLKPDALKKIQQQIDVRLFTQYGLFAQMPELIAKVVSHADSQALFAEAYVLTPGSTFNQLRSERGQPGDFVPRDFAVTIVERVREFRQDELIEELERRFHRLGLTERFGL